MESNQQANQNNEVPAASEQADHDGDRAGGRDDEIFLDEEQPQPEQNQSNSEEDQGEHQEAEQPKEQQQPAAMQLTAKEFNAKFGTKREVYDFATVHCGFYLPENQCVTIYWLRDILSGERKGKLKTS